MRVPVICIAFGLGLTGLMIAIARIQENMTVNRIMRDFDVEVRELDRHH